MDLLEYLHQIRLDLLVFEQGSLPDERKYWVFPKAMTLLLPDLLHSLTSVRVEQELSAWLAANTVGEVLTVAQCFGLN